MSTPPAVARRIGTRSTWHRRSCAAAGWRPYLTRVRPHARLVRNPRALDRCGDRSSPRIQGHLVAIMRSRSSGSLAAGPSASPEAADHPRRLPNVVLEYQPCAASQGFALVGRGPASLACVHEARRSRGNRRWRSGSRRCGGRRTRDRRSRACPWRFRPRSARIVDLQVNGFGGVDFLSTDVDGYRKAGQRTARLTAFQPTLITAPRQDLLAAIAVAREAARIGTGGVRILGVHLEGPFISPLRPGAHLKRGSSRKSLAQEAGRAIRVLLTRDGCRILAATSWAAR